MGYHHDDDSLMRVPFLASHEPWRPSVAVALKMIVFAVAALGTACVKTPPGRSPIDDVTVRGAHALSSSDIEDKLATAPSPKFLFAFRGVVYDYEIFDQATLQRDLARVERFCQARG